MLNTFSSIEQQEERREEVKRHRAMIDGGSDGDGGSTKTSTSSNNAHDLQDPQSDGGGDKKKSSVVEIADATGGGESSASLEDTIDSARKFLEDDDNSKGDDDTSVGNKKKKETGEDLLRRGSGPLLRDQILSRSRHNEENDEIIIPIGMAGYSSKQMIGGNASLSSPSDDKDASSRNPFNVLFGNSSREMMTSASSFSEKALGRKKSKSTASSSGGSSSVLPSSSPSFSGNRHGVGSRGIITNDNICPRRDSSDVGDPSSDLQKDLKDDDSLTKIEKIQDIAGDISFCICQHSKCIVWTMLLVISAFSITFGVLLLTRDIRIVERMHSPHKDDNFSSPENTSTTVNDMKRFHEIQKLVTSSKVSSVKDINKDGTPQHLALRWVTDWDEERIELGEESSKDLLLERYAMGVLFFNNYVTGYEQVPETLEEIQKEMNYFIFQLMKWDSQMKNRLEGKKNKSEEERKMLRDRVDDNEEQHEENGDHDLVENGKKNKAEPLPPPPDDYSSPPLNPLDQRLVFLNATKCQMGGKIPRELIAFKEARKIDFSYNSLVGTIPDVIGNMEKLEDIRLFSNKIEGSIPPIISNLNNLKHLNLNHNELTGTLPSSLGELVELQYLNVEHNHLAGTIDSRLGNLSKLGFLMIYHNNFTETIPESLCKLRDGPLKHLSADCSEPDPMIECHCCTHCDKK